MTKQQPQEQTGAAAGLTAAQAIPGGWVSQLSASARTALEYAADVIAQDHELRGGKTALYWHLASVAAKHIGDSAARGAAATEDRR